MNDGFDAYSSDCYDQVGLPLPLVRRKMAFWITHGLVLECPKVSPLVSDNASRTHEPTMAAWRRMPGTQGSPAIPTASRPELDCGIHYRLADSIDPALDGEKLSFLALSTTCC